MIKNFVIGILAVGVVIMTVCWYGEYSFRMDMQNFYTEQEERNQEAWRFHVRYRSFIAVYAATRTDIGSRLDELAIKYADAVESNRPLDMMECVLLIGAERQTAAPSMPREKLAPVPVP